jgi:hypothetical protein
MIVLRVMVEFTADEAEFLGLKLAELVERADTPVDRFWTTKMQERISLALQEVKAADAEGRLMAAGGSGVFGWPPAPVPLLATKTPPTTIVTSSTLCVCGDASGSTACQGLRTTGKHP